MIRRRLCVAIAPVLAALLGVGVFSSTAQAQSRPADGPLHSPATMAGGDATNGPDRGAPTAPRQNRFSDSYGTYDNGYPGSDVHAAVDANARATFARLEYRRMQGELDFALTTMKRTFEKSTAYVSAMRDEQQAWDDYRAARDAALRPIHEKAEFQANEKLRGELTQKIGDLRQTTDHLRDQEMAQRYANLQVDDEQIRYERTRRINDLEMSASPNMAMILSYATLKLSYASTIRDMEQDVLANDQHVKDARAKLIAAGVHTAQVRATYDDDVRNSQDMVNLRRALAEARVNAIVAQTYSDDACWAAGQAINYAYYQQAAKYHNQANYGWSPYGYAGYGYGAASVYGPRY